MKQPNFIKGDVPFSINDGDMSFANDESHWVAGQQDITKMEIKP